MSSLPGHDRLTEDEARAEAASVERDRPTVSRYVPGVDERPELRLYADRGVRHGGPGAVSQPTN